MNRYETQQLYVKNNIKLYKLLLYIMLHQCKLCLYETIYLSSYKNHIKSIKNINMVVLHSKNIKIISRLVIK